MIARRVLSANSIRKFARKAVVVTSSSATTNTAVLQSSCSFGSTTAACKKDYSDVIVPGSRHEYGSLGDVPSPQSKAVSWQAAHNVDIQNVTQKALIYELTQQQTRTIESVVPWFLENMPESYFRQIPEQFRMDHIKAVSSIRDANMDLYLNLKSQMPDGREVYTFIRPGTSSGTLLHMLEELRFKDGTDSAEYQPLTRLHVFSSQDETMSLNMFVYGARETRPLGFDVEQLSTPILDYAGQVQAGEFLNDADGRHPAPSPRFEKEQLLKYLDKCSHNYLNFGITNPRRFLLHREIINSVSGTEGTSVNIESEESGPGYYWVDVAVANTRPRNALENVCRLLYLHKFDVTRSRLDVVKDSDNGNITMLRMLVTPSDGSEVSQATFDVLKREIKRAKWLDSSTMNLVFDRYLWLGVVRGEIITGMCSLIHPVLAKENAIIYSKSNILDTVTHKRFIRYAADIASLFMDRFNPHNPLSEEDFESRSQELRKLISSNVEETVALEILGKMLDVVKCTLKTNVYMPNRYALSFRLDPKIMVSPHEAERELPYGIIFVHGRRFNGYHVRFRDIARGGMRLVTPPHQEQYALESARQYEECYGLAFAQQLKNKDIPEGGSKAVNLIDASGMSDTSKHFLMRKSVKGFVDSILDLIVSTDETKENIVDYFGKPEILYLGPDEQVIPDDINWIIGHAARRGYGTPAAFMSSKPRAGINHKEFGVTSEGVNVYLEVALRRVLGIDPTQESFTIKLTGGPDGDVAGNEIKILVREYGDNAKIVGLADVSGCAEDPDGLDHEELLRLVNNTLSISHFSKDKLGPNGKLSICDTDEGIKARNSMHNRVIADAFIPCGGRPNTVDITNYKHYLQKDGTPSSKLIVEGANLFITAEARTALFNEAGVVIVKDSSANKGGVITSSYEIIAAMLLTEEEFFENKTQIVAEVLEKLRGLAKLEANLLLTEFETNGGSLPEVSQIISNCINMAKDALSVALDDLTEQDREALLPLFRAHLPKTMADLAFDEVHQKVPAQYIKNAISSCLASKLVYKEGTSFILSMPKGKLASTALKYIQKEREIAALIEKLDMADLPDEDKAKISQLLEAGGARTALNMPE
eukprot:CAMPEP_0198139032 /NCGR_PEP_ID=MMETSP1443-20131203/2366_1 /TAXON_ID=186043 /ORGANISM="Entomoneis sp., Strain CCMP2396" /LENGTH=1102 /DNA_ID=CAMNT_0043801015 /DNA_START=154 /DNA_END=3462 /DNA_ORIENTATION=-